MWLLCNLPPDPQCDDMTVISPTRVYRAARRSVRWQLWATVAFFVFTLAVPVRASAEAQMSLADWLSPQTIFAIASVLFGVGMLVSELHAVKKQLEAQETKYARLDVLDLRFSAVMTELRAVKSSVDDGAKRWSEVNDRLEAFFPVLNAQINKIETDIHVTQKDIVRLETRNQK